MNPIVTLMLMSKSELEKTRKDARVLARILKMDIDLALLQVLETREKYFNNRVDTRRRA